MRTVHGLLAATMLLGAMVGTAPAASAQQPWISTWAAPPVARAEQPAQSLSAAAQAFPWARDVPPAVQSAAAGQQLEVGGASALHFKDQTLRQIAHFQFAQVSEVIVFENVTRRLSLLHP